MGLRLSFRPRGTHTYSRVPVKLTIAKSLIQGARLARPVHTSASVLANGLEPVGSDVAVVHVSKKSAKQCEEHGG